MRGDGEQRAGALRRHAAWHRYLQPDGAGLSLGALARTLAGNRIASRADASKLTAACTVLLAAVAVYALCCSAPGLM